MRWAFAFTLMATLIASRQAAGCGGGFASNSLYLAAAEDDTVAENACAALRALGAEGLDALYNLHREMIDKVLSGDPPQDDASRAQWKRVRLALDRVAGQRDAYTAHLFWYTDLEQAKQAARISNRPILSLRMLGKLSDEFSCANSRFFRSTLYANQEVGQLLRERFVLHWQSVRPVPVVTIDFGDGRKLQRTVTGNSAHYLLDSQGRVVDVLPGLYGPQAFTRWLSKTEGVAHSIAPLEQPEYARQVTEFHRRQLDALRTRWARDLNQLDVKFTPVQVGPSAPQQLANNAANVPAGAVAYKSAKPAARPTPQPTAVKASQRAVPKHVVEAPVLAAALGVSDESLTKATTDDLWLRLAQLHAGDAQLDPATVAFIHRQSPPATVASEVTVTKALAESPLARLLRTLQGTIALDTVRNEYLLHRQIHNWFVAGQVGALDALNERVYAELFLTPSSDAWLGLMPPDAYSALDNDGLVDCRQ